MSDALDGSQLSRKIQDTMGDLKVPGVAVGVLHEGKTFTAGFGVTNVDHPLSVDDSTLFQIGSITKTFVGMLGMRLVEMGKVELDAPVKKYLPDFRVPDSNAANKATLRHLFTHTAGWVGDFFPEDLGHGDDAVAKYVAAMAEDPQLTPVGETLSYNNAGFNVAGRVYEAVMGRPFDQVIKELIFEPLGMNHTYLLPWDVMTHRFAVGHVPKENGPEVARPWSIGRASGPAGGIVTNVKDMLKYARFQLGDGTTEDGTRLLKSDSLAALHSPQVKFSPVDTVALTWWLDDRRAVRTMGHGGGTVGQISQLLIAPARDFAIIIVTNAGNGGSLNVEVINWALEHYLGVQTPALAPVKLSQEKLQSYVGTYDAALSSSELTLSDDGLVITTRAKGGFPTKDVKPATTEATPPVRLVFYADDHVVALDPPFKDARGQFLRNPDGSLAWFRFGSRIQRPVGPMN